MTNATSVNLQAKKKNAKPFIVVGKMSWVKVKLGSYKNVFEANKAIKVFEDRKIYTDLRTEEI